MPFKTYTDFESLLKRVRGSDKKNIILDTLKEIRNTFIPVLPKTLFVDDKFSKPVALYRGRNAIYRFI